jgi:hypothetical protein
MKLPVGYWLRGLECGERKMGMYQEILWEQRTTPVTQRWSMNK